MKDGESMTAKNDRVTIEPLDWRYSAAIVGIYKYLFYHLEESKMEIKDGNFKFPIDLITNEKFEEFKDYFQTKNNLKSTRAGNSFYREKYNPKFEEKEIMKCGKTCRLKGYYVDPERKLKSLAYGFNEKTLVTTDGFIFDFVPFAFSYYKDDSYFINNNFTVEELINANIKLEHHIQKYQKSSEKNKEYILLKDVADFIDYDVEVICKNSNKDFYETVFLRNQAIEIFKSLDSNGLLCKPFDKKILGEKTEFQKELTNCIVNNLKLDGLIEKIMRISLEKDDGKDKKKEKYCYDFAKELIKVNLLIYGGNKDMEAEGKSKTNFGTSYYDAIMVKNKLLEMFDKKESNAEKKLKSYRVKLLTAVIANDFDKCMEYLLNLSSYTDVHFKFVHKLLEDFEGNKNMLYNFINELMYDDSNDKRINGQEKNVEKTEKTAVEATTE